MSKQVIMIVDDNIANLKIAKNALTDTYKVFTAVSAAVMFDLLERNAPEMILLDIDMPEMNGYEALKLLKANPRTASIPVIFLTAKSDSDSEIEGLNLGAIDYISKPFMPTLLCKRIELHLTVETQKHMLAAQVTQLQSAILKTVADLVESRDDITGGHVERTKLGLGILVEELKNQGIYTEQMADWDMDLLLQSSQLHDVGKIAISDSILLKPGKLTPEEFDRMKKHTIYGVQIIENIMKVTKESDFLRHAQIFAGTHQEKWDGSGYPNGLSGENIPLQGRLMAIVDVYDALVSERPYKKAFSHDEAVRIITQGKGTHFDPVLTEVFERAAGRFKDI